MHLSLSRASGIGSIFTANAMLDRGRVQIGLALSIFRKRGFARWRGEGKITKIRIAGARKEAIGTRIEIRRRKARKWSPTEITPAA